MTNIKYTLSVDGFINNFVLLGDLDGSKEVTINNFDVINFDCYKEVDGVLVLDEQKLQGKINIPEEPIVDREEVLKSKIEVVTINTLIDLGVI